MSKRQTLQINLFFKSLVGGVSNNEKYTKKSFSSFLVHIIKCVFLKDLGGLKYEFTKTSIIPSKK